MQNVLKSHQKNAKRLDFCLLLKKFKKCFVWYGTILTFAQGKKLKSIFTNI